MKHLTAQELMNLLALVVLKLAGQKTTIVLTDEELRTIVGMNINEIALIIDMEHDDGIGLTVVRQDEAAEAIALMAANTPGGVQ